MCAKRTIDKNIFLKLDKQVEEKYSFLFEKDILKHIFEYQFRLVEIGEVKDADNNMAKLLHRKIRLRIVVKSLIYLYTMLFGAFFKKKRIFMNTMGPT